MDAVGYLDQFGEEVRLSEQTERRECPKECLDPEHGQQMVPSDVDKGGFRGSVDLTFVSYSLV